MSNEVLVPPNGPIERVKLARGTEHEMRADRDSYRKRINVLIRRIDDSGVERWCRVLKGRRRPLLIEWPKEWEGGLCYLTGCVQWGVPVEKHANCVT